MKFKDFMSEIDSGLKNVYLLSGKENFYIDKAREKILSKLKIERQDIFTINYKEKMPMTDIINFIETTPLFTKLNVVLVKNATFFSGEGKFEQLEKVLEKILPKTYVIFITENADKRRKLYKIISKIGLVLDAEQLKSWEVGDWLNEKLKKIGKIMNGQARKFFLERIEVLPEISLYYLENEINKVAEYVSEKEITVKDLEKILTEPPELSNFAIIEAINAKQTEKALKILQNQLRDVYKIPLIIGLLAKHIRQLILAKFYLKRGLKATELTKQFEVTSSYIAQKICSVSASYSSKLLEEIFLDLSDADFNFKIGRAGAESLEKIVIKMCKR